uniref:PAS domain-containing sensor histidine kinase n=1 Tax=Shimia sp. TaxID=1954381 RepID=UPI0035624B0D
DGGFEWEYQLSNGRWVKSYNQNTREGGRVGIRFDVTTLKDQQAELEASNAEMKKAIEMRDATERRFADIANISKDWFWEQDSDSRFTYLSEGFERVTGIPAKELIGKTRAEFFHNDEVAKASGDWEWLADRMAARKPFEEFIYSLSTRIHDKSTLRLSGMPYHDSKGVFAGYRGVGSDVTVLADALEKAEASDRAKSEFLSVMTHELRTPLTVILGFNALLARPDILRPVSALRDYLENQTKDPETALSLYDKVAREIASYSQRIDSSGQHLLTIINDILDLSAIETGDLKISPEEVEVGMAVETVIEELGVLAQDKGIELLHETHSEKVLVDGVRFKQILINLVGNALKFTKEGHIRVTSQEVDGEVVISVEDTGCGIPEELHETVFDRFKQVGSADTRSQGGVGLGLAIVKKLVEIHGGTVGVSSTLGQGATFTVRLPAAEVEGARQITAA